LRFILNPVFISGIITWRSKTQTQGDHMSCKEIVIDGVKYLPTQPNGNRAVVVVDRGWIFAGDVTEKDGRLRLSRALHVLRWESVGFAGLIDNPKTAKAVLKPVSDVDMPADAEIFRCPVGQDWGL
jgi:hypothetical protein